MEPRRRRRVRALTAHLHPSTPRLEWVATTEVADEAELKLRSMGLVPVADEAEIELRAMYPGYSSAPLVTADPAEALAALREHGACVFEAAAPEAVRRMGPEEVQALAASVAPRVFGDALALAKAPTTKAEDGAPLRSQPHQDGGQAYGNAVNDYLMLLGAEPAEGGRGESYLLDAQAILASLPEHLQSALRETHYEQNFETSGFPFGRHLPPDHGARDSESAAAARAGRPTMWRGPLWRTDGTRPFFRCPTGGGTYIHRHMDYPVAGLPEGERRLAEEATLAFRQALLHADNAAPRFCLQPGQALLIDNYRMLHGRERFAGPRKIWRVWFWSKDWAYNDAPAPAWLADMPEAAAEEMLDAVILANIFSLSLACSDDLKKCSW